MSNKKTIQHLAHLVVEALEVEGKWGPDCGLKSVEECSENDWEWSDRLVEEYARRFPGRGFGGFFQIAIDGRVGGRRFLRDRMRAIANSF